MVTSVMEVSPKCMQSPQAHQETKVLIQVVQFCLSSGWIFLNIQSIGILHLNKIVKSQGATIFITVLLILQNYPNKTTFSVSFNDTSDGKELERSAEVTSELKRIELILWESA